MWRRLLLAVIVATRFILLRVMARRGITLHNYTPAQPPHSFEPGIPCEVAGG
jgi:hypothetical protein